MNRCKNFLEVCKLEEQNYSCINSYLFTDPRLHGTDRSHHPLSHHLSRSTIPMLSPEDPKLTSLRKIITNLSNDSIRRLLTRVVNPISKIREVKDRITKAGTIVRTCGENSVPPGTESEGVLNMAKGKTLKIWVSLGTGAKGTDSTVMKPSLPILLKNPEIGDRSKGKSAKDTTKPTKGSDDNQVMGTTLNSVTGQRHKVAGQGTLENILPTTMSTDPTTTKEDTDNVRMGGSITMASAITGRKQHPEGPTIRTGVAAAPIGTIITRRLGHNQRFSKWRGADPSMLTQINLARGHHPGTPLETKEGGGTIIPGIGPVEDQEDVSTIQKTGDDAESGPDARGNSNNNISENNSSLLLSIMNFFNPKKDPRLQKSAAFRKAFVVGKPEILGKMHSILRNLSEQAHEKDGDKSSKTSASLSLDDIKRIREKKQKMKEKRDAEKELSKKEAMHMREELNKSIDRRARILHQTVKKSKPTKKIGETMSTCSPTDSTSSSTSSELSRKGMKTTAPIISKPMFNLTLPASTQVLSDVAFALAEPKAGDKVPVLPDVVLAGPMEDDNVLSAAVAARPTGVVTPTPRPMHPIFMQGPVEFPLVGESSAVQSDPNTIAKDPSHPTHVMTEIDDTLSQLKRGLQGSRNENEVKESTAKLLQLVLKLGGASSETVSQSDSTDLTNSAASLSRFLTRENASHPVQTGERTMTRIQDARAPVEPITTTNLSNTDVKTNIPTRLTDCSQIQANRFHFLLSSMSIEKLNASVKTSRKKSYMRSDIRPRFVESREAFVQEFRKRIGATPGSNEAVSQQNIDEILNKLRPYIETIQHEKPSVQENIESNRTAAVHSSDTFIFTATNPKKVHSMDKATQPESTLTAICESETAGTADVVVSMPKTSRVVPVVARKQAVEKEGLNDSPKVLKLLKPIPIQPASILMENPDPPVIVDQPVQVIEARQTSGMTSVVKSRTTSPRNRSDSSTPTMDERYPEPVARKVENDTNWFVVFDPHKSPECEAIQHYLMNVNGVTFDLNKMKLVQSEGETNGKEKDGKNVLSLDSIRNQLPDGKLWIVLR